MNEIQAACWNNTPDLFNKSWSGGHYYQMISAAETIILPSLIGIICSTGLIGNILIVITIIRTKKKSIPDIYICNLAIADLVHIIGMPFLIHQWARGGQWVFGSPLCTIITSLDTCNQFACSAIMTVMSLDSYRYTLYFTITTFFFPLPLIFVCYILILCYTWEMYQQNKKAGCYNTGIPRQRVMRLTRMVLVLVGVFVVSAAPYHVIQLVNLRISQPTLAFYMSYYSAICLSYASSSINPFLYILLSGNFQKRLSQSTSIKVKMTEREVNNIENTMKSSF
ncbi:PREDICTED: melanin-concentrating hormone receptor 2 [Crocodylus porosus]|uniref:melanin-concentrating hormone receptor 2 n=1 Tax=Crocodylus porosus TaxID=8502 RepID=UPI00093E8F4A|nr:PREDICTED: melanin-concentrating hormone receptor 2 [Crocodylus porosus]